MGQIEGRIKIMKRKITIIFVFIALIIKGQEWKIVDETDGQIFPSAVISMAHITEDKLKECIEMIEKNEMPINSYLIMNSKAKLNNNQKAKLISWFKSLRNFESDKPKKHK